MTALAFILATLAFALFGLSTDAHHRRRLGNRPDAVTVLRMRGGAWAAVAAAFPFAIAAQGWVFGPILWVALLMLGAGLVFLALNLIPRHQGANESGRRDDEEIADRRIGAGSREHRAGA